MKRIFSLEPGDRFLHAGRILEVKDQIEVCDDGQIRGPRGAGFSGLMPVPVSEGGRNVLLPIVEVLSALQSKGVVGRLAPFVVEGGDGVKWESGLDFLFPGDMCQLDGYAVNATIVDDHAEFEIKFDARLWLQQASDEEIIGLHKCGYTGAEESDSVGQFFQDINPRIGNLFDNKRGGFNVSVDEDDVIAWVALNRPELAQKIAELEN